MYKTEWTHQPTPELNKQQEEFLEKEIGRIFEELDRASDLIFHTVFLTEDQKGAIVIIDGQEGVDDTLFLTYYEKPSWTTLADMKDTDSKEDIIQEMTGEWKWDNN